MDMLTLPISIILEDGVKQLRNIFLMVEFSTRFMRKNRILEKD